jgi:hypothetical protein
MGSGDARAVGRGESLRRLAGSHHSCEGVTRLHRTLPVWFAALVVALAGQTSLVYAQPEATGKPLMGKVTLYDGRTFQGDIEFAQFGVIGDGDGVGSKLPDEGSIRLNVNGQEETVPAADIQSVEAQWKNMGDEAKADWQITQVTVVKRDGTKVVGQPAWRLAASTVRIATAEGEQPTRISALPLGRLFDQKNLLVKIELTGGAAAPAPTPAVTPPTPPTETTTETEATTPPTVPPVPGGGETAEEAVTPPTAPAGTAPTGPIATPPTGPIVTPPTPAVVTPPVAVGPVRPAVGAPVPVGLTLTIICPHCGKPITIDLAAYLRAAAAEKPAP